MEEENLLSRVLYARFILHARRRRRRKGEKGESLSLSLSRREKIPTVVLVVLVVVVEGKEGKGSGGEISSPSLSRACRGLCCLFRFFLLVCDVRKFLKDRGPFSRLLHSTKKQTNKQTKNSSRLALSLGRRSLQPTSYLSIRHLSLLTFLACFPHHKKRERHTFQSVLFASIHYHYVTS